MMHTEEEAKKLYCPFAAISGAMPGIVGPEGRAWDACISSRCMMWRWVTTLDGDKGYCGLAGVPK